MKLGDFFDFICNCIRVLIVTATNPSQVCRSILDEDLDSRKSFLRALKIWFVGALTTIIFIQGSIYRYYKINPFDIDFCLSIAIVMLMGLLVLSASVYLAFLIYKLPVPFSEILITFLVFTAVFFPLIGLIFVPTLALILDVLMSLKNYGTNLLFSWEEFSKRTIETKEIYWTIWGLFQVFASSLYGYLIALQFSLIFDFWSERRDIERTRVFDAGTFGLMIGSPLAFLLAAMYLFTVYSFI